VGGGGGERERERTDERENERYGRKCGEGTWLNNDQQVRGWPTKRGDGGEREGGHMHARCRGE
jgi:hypothetical protein